MRRLWLDGVTVGDVLRSVSLTVDAGEMVCVWAADRRSRLALLETAAGVLVADEGRVWVAGRVVLAHRSWPAIAGRSVLGQLVLPLLAGSRSVSAARVRVLARLSDWGVEGWSARDVRDLNEHEQRRLAVMRALIVAPDVLLVDDPLSSMESEPAAGELLGLLEQARGDGMAVLVAAGSVQAMRNADGLFTISQGELRGLRRRGGVVVSFGPHQATG
jgi:predicted ABC-type transport system involved in lysophospholipase L1 biosynthesis ATPase subunit